MRIYYLHTYIPTPLHLVLRFLVFSAFPARAFALEEAGWVGGWRRLGGREGAVYYHDGDTRSANMGQLGSAMHPLFSAFCARLFVLGERGGEKIPRCT